MRVYRLKDKPHDGPVHWAWRDIDPLGRVLVAVTQDHLCWLGFADLGEAITEAAFLRQWGDAELINAPHPLMDRVAVPQGAVPLWLRGTSFQHHVWAELLKIPQGSLSSYGAIARAIGNPKAARAVGNAVGANPVSWCVPCHRVAHRSGRLSGFMWGEACKRRLLALEGYSA